MKLFYYAHCPFCIRILMLIRFKNLDIAEILLPNDDEETPIAMTGRKVLPVLQKDSGEYLPESLDIIQYLDNLESPVLPAHEEPKSIVEWLDRAKPILRKLTYPRMIQYPFKEFETQSARDYFERKKSKMIGPFAELIDQTEQLLTDFRPILNELSNHIAKTSNSLAWEDIYLFPYLLSLTLVPGVQWPPAIKQHLDKQCKLFGIAAYTV